MVALIGIIASIAAVRMLRVAQSTAEASMKRNLDLMQRAIDLYAQEHAGSYPHPALIEQQLTQYTDVAGTVSTQKEVPYVLGPYLSKIPRVPAGPQQGSSRIAEAPEPGVGWIYLPERGEIAANTVTADAVPAGDTAPPIEAVAAKGGESDSTVGADPSGADTTSAALSPDTPE